MRSSRFSFFLRASLRAVTALAFVATLTACGKSTPAPAAAQAPGAPGAGGPPPATPVHVVQVTPQNVPIAFDAVGQTEGSKQVEVRARVAGILQQRLYTEGTSVKAGAPLFQIDRAPFDLAHAQARAALAQEQARAAQTRREADRLKPLAEERAISRKDYDDALSNAQMAQASVEQALAKVKETELNLSYTRVTAPVSGITGRAERSEGSLITTDANGSLLTTIAQVNPIWVRFSLAQSDLAKLPAGRLGRAASGDVQLILADGSKYPAKGRINFTATEIDPKLGTQQLRAEFANGDERLLPGQFVRVRIVAGQHDNVFLVPQSAVMQTEKGQFVFVVDNGTVGIRPVTTGEWVGNNWIVMSGINPGDKVIVDNLLKLRPGAPVVLAPPAPAAPAVGGAPATAAPPAGVAQAPGAAPAGAPTAPPGAGPAPAGPGGPAAKAASPASK